MRNLLSVIKNPITWPLEYTSESVTCFVGLVNILVHINFSGCMNKPVMLNKNDPDEASTLVKTNRIQVWLVFVLH